MSKAPAVEVGFSQTPIFLRSQGSKPASQVEDDKGKEEADDQMRKITPPSSPRMPDTVTITRLSAEDGEKLARKLRGDPEMEVFEYQGEVRVNVEDENPLLEPSEKLSKQDANNIFLTGVLTGGFAVALFFLVRWMLSPRQPTKEDFKMILEQFLDD